MQLKDNHAKIIKRDDKSTVTINVRAYTNSSYQFLEYEVRVCVRPYRGRTDRFVTNRAIPDYVTPEEILSAKMELWEQLKPTIL